MFLRNWTFFMFSLKILYLSLYCFLSWYFLLWAAMKLWKLSRLCSLARSFLLVYRTDSFLKEKQEVVAFKQIL